MTHGFDLVKIFYFRDKSTEEMETEINRWMGKISHDRDVEFTNMTHQAYCIQFERSGNYCEVTEIIISYRFLG